MEQKNGALGALYGDFQENGTRKTEMEEEGSKRGGETENRADL